MLCPCRNRCRTDCTVHTLDAFHAMHECMHKCQGQYVTHKQEAGQMHALPVWKQVLHGLHSVCAACHAVHECIHKCQGQCAVCQQDCKQEAGQTRALPVWKQVPHRLFGARAECTRCVHTLGACHAIHEFMHECQGQHPPANRRLARHALCQRAGVTCPLQCTR